jgi:hypothetical protein
MLLILLQKGRLIELYGPSRSSVIYTNEEEDVKKLFVMDYNNIVSKIKKKEI